MHIFAAHPRNFFSGCRPTEKKRLAPPLYVYKVQSFNTQIHSYHQLGNNSGIYSSFQNTGVLKQCHKKKKKNKKINERTNMQKR